MRQSLLAHGTGVLKAFQTVGEIRPMRIPSALAVAGVGQITRLLALIAALQGVRPIDLAIGFGVVRDGDLATGAHGKTLVIGDRRADASHRFEDVFEQATTPTGFGTSRANDISHVGVDPGLGFGREEVVDGKRSGLGLLGSSVVAIKGDVSVVDDSKDALMTSLAEVEGVVGDYARAVSMVGEGT